jgi:hypothetical protein
VFVHIGPQIPEYASFAISQARTFNPDCPIIFVASQNAINRFAPSAPPAGITYISTESLKPTPEHFYFKRHTHLDSKWRNGFTLYTSERFLYLQDLVVQYNLKNVFHLENDVMLYVNLETLLLVFESQYKGIAVTMNNDQQCIAGFIYISNSVPMNLLASYFGQKAYLNQNDMIVMANFKNAYREDIIDDLPIIFKEYLLTQPFKSISGFEAKNPADYCRHIDLFQSIFDGAALGQYLGGGDLRNGNYGIGFVNPQCLFNPSKLDYEWIVDEEGRRVPYAIYNNKKYRINNLHIHSKNLSPFLSKQMSH